MRKFSLLLFVLVLISSCVRHRDKCDIFQTLKIKPKLSVIIFLSPVCPMCQNYSLTLNHLKDIYKDKSISFFGVFPAKEADSMGINVFARTYKTNFGLIADPEMNITSCLQATVTPEVYFVDSNREILYQGSIDNWLIEPGQKRTIITEHYLEDALQAYTAGNEIKVKKTEAKGCLIE